MSRNVLTGNLWGVTLVRSGTTGGPAVSFGNLSSADTTDVGLNRLTGNGNSGQVYDFYNNTPDAVKAESNDWGSATASVIEAHIYHQPDMATLGLVDFQPFRQPLSARAATPRLAAEAYPNPTHTTVTFRLPGAAPVRVQLHDATGRLVLDQVLRPLNGQVRLETGLLPAGLYSYQLTQEIATGRGRLVVQ